MNVFTFQAKSISIPVFASVSVIFGALLLAGCGRNDVATYRVPKETAEPAMASANPHGGDMMGGHGDAMAAPKIQYKTPEGWQEAPVKGGMRAAQFSITNNAGQEAEVAVIPMPGASAASGDIVNMWRDQLGLKSAGEIAGSAVEIGSSQGQLYDMASTEPLIDNKFKARIMSALLKQGQTVWIFKMAGEDDLVRQQKPAFLAFLKSIQFAGASEPAEMASAPMADVASAGAPQKPTWEAPSTWKEEPPPQMVLAKYVVNAQAEVTVSAFPGDVGGLLANVNRWRGQIGLPQIEQADLSKQITSFDVLGGRATLVDMTGTNKTGQKARLIGAIVPRGDQTWFYKMTGDEQVVGGEKEAFVKWVQSVKYAQ